ncbi:MAG: histidine kinase, partial [Saprospiraceae bacterium]
ALHERFVQRKQIDEIQVQKLNAEVNYLKAQINPHFLFNTLNNLYALSLEKSDKAPQSILMLSKMMDYMLYETSESKVSLQKEIENIQNYIGLERIRQGNDAQIKYTIQGEIRNQNIVPLILLPLIENAFKHGVNQLIRKAYIDIRIEISDNQLAIFISNNYKKAAEQTNHGIGLINLRKQLELYYPHQHEFAIKDSGLEFDVSLKLNLV